MLAAEWSTFKSIKVAKFAEGSVLSLLQIEFDGEGSPTAEQLDAFLKKVAAQGLIHELHVDPDHLKVEPHKPGATLTWELERYVKFRNGRRQVACAARPAEHRHHCYGSNRCVDYHRRSVLLPCEVSTPKDSRKSPEGLKVSNAYLFSPPRCPSHRSSRHTSTLLIQVNNPEFLSGGTSVLGMNSTFNTSKDSDITKSTALGVNTLRRPNGAAAANGVGKPNDGDTPNASPSEQCPRGMGETTYQEWFAKVVSAQLANDGRVA